MLPDENKYKVHFYLLLLQIFFSLLPAVSKLAFSTFNANIVTFFRIVGAAILFGIIYFLWQREKIIDPKHYLYFALLAFLGVAGNQYFYLQGLERTTAVNASLLIAMIPVFTFINALIFKMEYFSLIRFIGVFTALFGVLNILNLDNFNFGGYLEGNLLIILNSFLYSLFLVVSKPLFKIYKPFTIVTMTFIFAAVEIIPFTVMDVVNIDYLAISAGQYIPLVILVVGATFFPYLIVNFALQKADSTLIAIYTYVQPLLASFLAVVLVGEKITSGLIFAGVFILAGLSMVSFGRLYIEYLRKIYYLVKK